MNQKQMNALWIGTGIIVLMGLFPPYQGRGYHFLFSPPAGRIIIPSIDFERLFIQWGLVALLTVVAVFAQRILKR